MPYTQYDDEYGNTDPDEIEGPPCGEDCECCYYRLLPPSAAELARHEEKRAEEQRQHDEDSQWFAE